MFDEVDNILEQFMDSLKYIGKSTLLFLAYQLFICLEEVNISKKWEHTGLGIYPKRNS